MDVPAIGARFAAREPFDNRDTTLSDQRFRLLRARWRAASLASGWRFPSDWPLPEVDMVCAVVIRGVHSEEALAGLARARAASGAGLSETLNDLAALHAVLAHFPAEFDRSVNSEFASHSSSQLDSLTNTAFIVPDVDATPARLIRVTAVAWADVALDQLANTEVDDSLTGLPAAAYLRTRLGEVYRQAARDGRHPSEDHTLLVVSADLSMAGGWSRLACMILISDVLRAVFDGGESVASLGPSVVAVLVARDGEIARHAVLLRRKLTERFAVDSQLRGLAQPRIQLVRLPATQPAANELLIQLGRQ